MRIFTGLALLAALLLMPGLDSARAQSGDGWTVYENARFGTAVEYPARLFALVQRSANGDGATFASDDGRLRFLVFGQHNYDGLGIRALAVRDAADDRFDDVTYRKTGRDWYVLSGYAGDDIFYRKAVLGRDGVVHVLEITYPPSEKGRMDPVVARMAGSLSGAP